MRVALAGAAFLAVALMGPVRSAELGPASPGPAPPGTAPGSPGIAPTLPPPLPEVEKLHTVKGEIVKVEHGAYLVRDSNGKEVRLPLGKQTKLDMAGYMVGDEVEAQMTSAGEVVSLTLKKPVSKRNP